MWTKHLKDAYSGHQFLVNVHVVGQQRYYTQLFHVYHLPSQK